MTASQRPPSSAESPSSRSPRSFSTSGKSSGIRLAAVEERHLVPSCERASTVARPRNFVPPRTSSFTARTLPHGQPVEACGFLTGPGQGVRCPREAASLNEAECYARCYGEGDDNVRFVKLEPRRPRFDLGVSGEELRRAFEMRLDEREPDGRRADRRRRGQRRGASRGRLRADTPP